MSTLTRTVVTATKLGKPLGPYSSAVIADRTVYVSGCLGMDKDTGKLVPGGVAAEAKKALENMAIVLEAANSGFDRVVKCTVFLNDMNDFAAVNEEYKKVFAVNPPARSCFQVAKLPANGLVEIEAIAMTGSVETVQLESPKSSL